MNFSQLLIFSMSLSKSLAMPFQATISEDSLMVSQNNANGNPKFRLKVHRNISVIFKTNYRDSPLSTVSISTVPGLVRFANSTKYVDSPV